MHRPALVALLLVLFLAPVWAADLVLKDLSIQQKEDHLYRVDVTVAAQCDAGQAQATLQLYKNVKKVKEEAIAVGCGQEKTFSYDMFLGWDAIVLRAKITGDEDPSNNEKKIYVRKPDRGQPVLPTRAQPGEEVAAYLGLEGEYKYVLRYYTRKDAWTTVKKGTVKDDEGVIEIVFRAPGREGNYLFLLDIENEKVRLAYRWNMVVKRGEKVADLYIRKLYGDSAGRLEIGCKGNVPSVKAYYMIVAYRLEGTAELAYSERKHVVLRCGEPLYVDYSVRLEKPGRYDFYARVSFLPLAKVKDPNGKNNVVKWRVEVGGGEPTPPTPPTPPSPPSGGNAQVIITGNGPIKVTPIRVPATVEAGKPYKAVFEVCTCQNVCQNRDRLEIYYEKYVDGQYRGKKLIVVPCPGRERFTFQYTFYPGEHHIKLVLKTYEYMGHDINVEWKVRAVTTGGSPIVDMAVRKKSEKWVDSLYMPTLRVSCTGSGKKLPFELRLVVKKGNDVKVFVRNDVIGCGTRDYPTVKDYTFTVPVETSVELRAIVTPKGAKDSNPANNVIAWTATRYTVPERADLYVRPVHMPETATEGVYKAVMAVGCGQANVPKTGYKLFVNVLSGGKVVYKKEFMGSVACGEEVEHTVSFYVEAGETYTLLAIVRPMGSLDPNLSNNTLKQVITVTAGQEEEGGEESGEVSEGGGEGSGGEEEGGEVSEGGKEEGGPTYPTYSVGSVGGGAAGAVVTAAYRPVAYSAPQVAYVAGPDTGGVWLPEEEAATPSAITAYATVRTEPFPWWLVAVVFLASLGIFLRVL